MVYQDRLRTNVSQAQEKARFSLSFLSVRVCFGTLQGASGESPHRVLHKCPTSLCRHNCAKRWRNTTQMSARRHAGRTTCSERSEATVGKASFACLRHFIATENDLFFHQDRLGTSIKGNSKEEGRLLLFVKLCTFTDAHGGRPGTRWLRLNFPTADEVREGKRRGMPDIYQERAAAAQVPACSREHICMQSL
jgi:hypothetical protein